MPIGDAARARREKDDLPARVRDAVRGDRRALFVALGKSCSTCDDGRERCTCGLADA